MDGQSVVVAQTRPDLPPCANCGRAEVLDLHGPSQPYGSGYWCKACFDAYKFGQQTQTDWLCHLCPELPAALERWNTGTDYPMGPTAVRQEGEL